MPKSGNEQQQLKTLLLYNSPSLGCHYHVLLKQNILRFCMSRLKASRLEGSRSEGSMIFFAFGAVSRRERRERSLSFSRAFQQTDIWGFPPDSDLRWRPFQKHNDLQQFFVVVVNNTATYSRYFRRSNDLVCALLFPKRPDTDYRSCVWVRVCTCVSTRVCVGVEYA